MLTVKRPSEKMSLTNAHKKNIRKTVIKNAGIKQKWENCKNAEIQITLTKVDIKTCWHYKTH